jgi:hypothetical protein
LPAAAAVVLLIVTGEDPELPTSHPLLNSSPLNSAALNSASLNSVVQQRPLSWRSSLPEGRLAVAPGTGSLSFSVPPRPQRSDETVLFKDSSASLTDEPIIG